MRLAVARLRPSLRHRAPRRDAALVRQRRRADPDPARLQPGRLSRQGGRPERLPPVAAGLRSRLGLLLDHPRTRRPPHPDRRPRGEPLPPQAGRPGPARRRQAPRRRQPRIRDAARLDPRRRPRHSEGRADRPPRRARARQSPHEAEPGTAAHDAGRVHRRRHEGRHPRHAVRRQRSVGRQRHAGRPRHDAAARRDRRSVRPTRDRSPSSPSPVRIPRPCRPRSTRSGTTSSTSTSSRSSPTCISNRRICAATRSSCAASISTPSASCRRRPRCARSWPTSRADKRNRVIDRLFDRPEYVDFWALELGDLLQNRKESRPRRPRRQGGSPASTTGSASRWRPIGPGTRWPASS